MKKWKGLILILLLFLLICFVVISFSKCCASFSEASIMYRERICVDDQNYTLHSFKKVCFADAYYWDGSEDRMLVNVPDECNGYKVTSLGGFAGTGVPSPFGIQIPNTDMGYEEDLLPENAVVHPLCFTIHIGRNVDRLELTTMHYFYRDADTQEFYQILVTVHCSEENETFYSNNGKLYWWSDDSLVDSFFYTSDYTAE